MGILDKVKKGSKESARKTAEKITDGLTPNTHIGNHSIESLSQEVFSLRNIKPMFRDGKWRKRFANVEANILDKISHGQNQYQSLLWELDQVKEMR